MEICLKLVVTGAQEREGSGGLINKLEMSGFLGKGVRNHLDLVSLARLGFPCLTSSKALLNRTTFLVFSGLQLCPFYSPSKTDE